MSLPQRIIDLLYELLKEVTASVVIDGHATGTAFFIDSELLLTCKHVIKNHESCGIDVVGRGRRTASVVEKSEKADLALLSITTIDPAEPAQPCVALHDQLHQGDHHVAGFPKEEGVDAGLERFRVTCHLRQDIGGDDQLMQIEAGKVITWGMSGGPVLSAHTGAVVGVVRSAKDPTDALGGGAIPISHAARVFEVINNLHRRPTPAVRRWRDVLERDNWQVLGKPWDMQVCIDLWVSGKRTEWQISLGDAAGVPHVRRVSDLGEDVAEALFRWAAQRRRIHGKEEVELLGRLLAKGIIPAVVEERMRNVTGADTVHVRLHIETGNDLADIPWELAAVPGQPTKFLAADKNFCFSRVVSDVGAGMTGRKPLVGPVKVLAVLAQPRAWRFPAVRGRTGNPPYRWPGLEEMKTNLRTSIDGDPFTLTMEGRPQRGDVDELLESGEYSVFHYTGFGKLSNEKEPLIAFVDADGDQASWEEASDVLALAAAHGIRLVVLEFMLPPEGHEEFDTLTSSKLGRLVSGGIDAVVLTQQPVHAQQCRAFNSSFYENIKKGLEVERAMQLARKKLANNKPVEDAAGFGWFAMVTGPLAGIRLVAPSLDDTCERSVHRPGSGRQAAGSADSEPRRDTGDGFDR
ncbi:MAG: trypsin-like peptidase domain-containing protein [Pseudonocardiaceae bacterium]